MDKIEASPNPLFSNHLNGRINDKKSIQHNRLFASTTCSFAALPLLQHD